MDNSTLKKYFNLGDHVELSMQRDSIIGMIVDFSDYTIVVEDNTGSPVVISLDSVLSCKKHDNTVKSIASDSSNIENLDSESIGVDIINNAVQSLEKIYEICKIQPESIINTNAKVVGISSEGVDVLTDDNQAITCIKSSFVGYSRENAAVGNRVFCTPGKNNKSYSSISEMTYSELFERFVRAINTKPVPRSTIVGSILYYLTKEYGNHIQAEKKNIKQLVRKLNGSKELEGTSVEAPSASTRLKLSDISIDQKNAIYDILNTHKLELSELVPNDQMKYAESLLLDNLKIKIRKIALKSILSEILSPNSFEVEVKISEESIKSNVDKGYEDPYLSATCEINKYYPQYRNGTLKDGDTDGIRFKSDVVIDEVLINKLPSCWTTPIPVICTYKMTGKWNVATFITEPGTLSELRSKVLSLRSAGKSELADSLSEYIEKNGHIIEPDMEIDLSLSSAELLTTTRRQRLIKNFEQAEKGFLELISRNYEFDAVVRDLAAMYQECFGPKKAIEVLETYLQKLEEKVKTYNQLSLLYQAVGDKEKAIDVMTKSLELIPPTTKANQKKIAKLNKRISLLEKNLNISSIDSSQETTELIDLLSDIEIPSELIRYDANNLTNNVLAYVKDKTIEEKIGFVNQRIGELKNSPELPYYYLAKVQLIESTGESSSSKLIKDSLADYCRAKARNYFNEGNCISAREYLLEGIKLCEREDLYYLLFLSLITSSTEVILSKYNAQFKSYDEITTINNSLVEDYDVYYVLLRMIAQDCVSSRRLLKTIYSCDSCEWVLEELDIDNKSPEEFVKKISNEARGFHNNLVSFESQLESFVSIGNALELSKSLLNVQIPSTKEISSYDRNNLASVLEIANLAVDFGKNFGYEECDEISRNAIQKMDAVIGSIQQHPTHLSSLRILPIILKYKDLFERLLNKKYAETIPNIVVSAIDDARIIGEDVEIQISVSNEVGFQRANNCILCIDSINGKDTTNLLLKSSFDTPLVGGGILTSSFTVKSSFIKGDELNLSYSFSYVDTRKKEWSKKGQFALVINRGNDYEDFENPYIAHVKSNAVKDKSMFKGRDEIIDTICTYVLEDYKGYVLYGQKRSGKSSVLYHITQRLREEHKAFAVEYTMGNNIVQDSESENDSMANLFYTIISEIGRAIKEVDRTVYKESGCHIIRRQEFETYPDQTFREYLDFYRDIIHDKLHYEQDKIVLIVDEFTYLYYHILEGKISSGIMEFWKGLVESRVFSFVFAGQDAMPRFMDEFQNVFASMHPQELTYIDEISARELIEKPIWNTNKNSSRYTDDAVNEILKLTACSPFYIMILCSELVKFARQRKRLPIQVSDVNALVQKMICNESSISRKDFDNLISCGESRLDLIDKDESLKVLKEIAIKSRNVDFYDIDAISAFTDKGKVRNIIEDLLRRGVLERHPEFGNKVKIKVGLFKRWLLNHE